MVFVSHIAIKELFSGFLPGVRVCISRKCAYFTVLRYLTAKSIQCGLLLLVLLALLLELSQFIPQLSEFLLFVSPTVLLRKGYLFFEVFKLLADGILLIRIIRRLHWVFPDIRIFLLVKGL